MLYCKVYVVTRHYQEYAAQRIVESSSVGLFIDMGMGKTIIALTALMKLLANRRIGKALVIAPLRVAETTWSDEAAKWEHTRHMRISKVLGSKSARFQALDAPADIYVINRENVPWLVEYLGKRWPFDMVIIDELSSFKSGQSVRFKALKSVRPRISRMVGLTGTPMTLRP